MKEIRTPQQIETWKTATLYLLVHAAVGLALSLQARSAEKNSLSIPPTALILLLVGCAIFASSLYGLVLTQIGLLGAVAPIGGLLMIAGWLVLALRLRT